MPATARDLLTLARDEARKLDRPTREQAETAITALGYPARELQRLTSPAADRAGASQQWASVAQLITACDAVTAAWPARPGRLADLLGAACDLLHRHDADLVEGERWAVTVELSRVTRHCVEAALRHRPYGRIPVLHVLRTSAIEVEQQAVRHPPEQASTALLDLPVPAPHPNEITRSTSVLNAVTALNNALRVDCAAGPLPISAALATTAAAEHAARRCARSANTRSGAKHGAWEHSPDSWQALSAALVRFHDGSRRRRAEPSATVQAAHGLHGALDRITLDRGVDGDLDADAASAMCAVARQLPLLARQLELAADMWGRDRALYARARDLLRTDGLVPAILHESAVPVGAEHLVPVITAIRVTERLSAALSSELNRTTGGLGHPSQPYRAAALAAPESHRQLQADAEWAARLTARLAKPTLSG